MDLKSNEILNQVNLDGKMEKDIGKYINFLFIL